jgi:hypothetical protein
MAQLPFDLEQVAVKGEIANAYLLRVVRKSSATNRFPKTPQTLLCLNRALSLSLSLVFGRLVERD